MLEGTAQQHDPQNQKEATHSKKEEGDTYLQGADAQDVSLRTSRFRQAFPSVLVLVNSVAASTAWAHAMYVKTF